MRRSLLPLTVLLLVGCHAPGGVETAEPVAEVTAPEIKVDTLLFPSSTVSLKGQRGKVVLLDFWATWCGPCRAITPTLEKIYADHKAQGLEAMAITHEDREVVARTERRLPHAMPVYLDSDGGAHKAFGAASLPTIVVVDRQGHIAYRTAGFGDGTVAALTAAVKKALRSG